MTKQILLIVDAYPPDRGGRAEKVERRVYYLTKNGWNVDVLAPFSRTAQAQRELTEINGQIVRVIRTDYLLRRQLPSLKHNETRTIDTDKRSIAARLLDLLFVPKGYIRWLPFAVTHGYRLATQADIILSINNPITLHIIGWILHLITRKPWVIELRDAIINYEYNRRGPELLNQLLEQIFVRSATLVLSWTDTGTDDVSKRYPQLTKNKFVSLFPIGYDPSRFSKYNATYPKKGLPLICTYTGSFYGDIITPYPILTALAHCVQKHNLSTQDIQFWFAGSWSDSYDCLVDDLGLRSYVHYKGWLSHQECLTLWSSSDVLVLLLGEQEARRGLIPTKLWDYIAAQRPILCLAPPSSRIGQLVIEDRLGEVAAMYDVEKISAAIFRLLVKKRNNELNGNRDTKLLDRWSCEPMETLVAKILTKFIDEVDQQTQ